MSACRIAKHIIDSIGVGLRAAIEREAMWRSTLHENYDDNFSQWLSYSDMHGLAGRLGFTTAEEAWDANPTIQGSTDTQDFKVVPEGEQMDMQLQAVLGQDPCEQCGSNEEPCDCRLRPAPSQPPISGPRRRVDAVIYEPTAWEQLKKDWTPKVRCSSCGATRLPEDMKTRSDGKRICLHGCRVIKEPSTAQRAKWMIGDLGERIIGAGRKSICIRCGEPGSFTGSTCPGCLEDEGVSRYHNAMKRIGKQLVQAEIEMIESPDLEWDRFVSLLSPEDKKKAGGLFSESMVANPPQNPQAQMRAIRERIARP